MCDLFDLNKILFLQLLNLKAIAPVNPAKEEIMLNEHTCQSTNLLEKNNNIKTGYENYCLTKGAVKLFPFKDFDFIGKNVVCQKCCLKFVSKMSYIAHVGADFCVRTDNGPNLEYLKYKSKKLKQLQKKEKQKLLFYKKNVTDLQGHDTKKNLLNPEMLDTLQTRNNCYSDVVHQRNKAKEKLRSNSSNKNDEPPTKKLRGRPRKNIEVEPKKFSEMTNSQSQSCNSLDNNVERLESDLKFLSEHYQSNNEYTMKDELDEIKQCMLKEFDNINNGSTTDKGKKNENE